MNFENLDFENMTLKEIQDGLEKIAQTGESALTAPRIGSAYDMNDVNGLTFYHIGKITCSTDMLLKNSNLKFNLSGLLTSILFLAKINKLDLNDGIKEDLELSFVKLDLDADLKMINERIKELENQEIKSSQENSLLLSE